MQEPKGFFHIISKDGHFQRLVDYLKEDDKIKAACWKSIREIPLLNQGQIPSDIEGRICHIIERFSHPNIPRPRARKTLGNAINSFFRKLLSEKELSDLIAELKRRKVIGIDNEKVTFHLPQSSSPAPVEAPAKKKASA